MPKNLYINTFHIWSGTKFLFALNYMEISIYRYIFSTLFFSVWSYFNIWCRGNFLCSSPLRLKTFTWQNMGVTLAYTTVKEGKSHSLNFNLHHMDLSCYSCQRILRIKLAKNLSFILNLSFVLSGMPQFHVFMLNVLSFLTLWGTSWVACWYDLVIWICNYNMKKLKIFGLDSIPDFLLPVLLPD